MLAATTSVALPLESGLGTSPTTGCVTLLLGSGESGKVGNGTPSGNPYGLWVGSSTSSDVSTFGSTLVSLRGRPTRFAAARVADDARAADDAVGARTVDGFDDDFRGFALFGLGTSS